MKRNQIQKIIRRQSYQKLVTSLVKGEGKKRWNEELVPSTTNISYAQSTSFALERAYYILYHTHLPKALLLSCQSPTTQVLQQLFTSFFSQISVAASFPLTPSFNSNLKSNSIAISPVMFLSHLPYMEDPLLKSDTWPGIILLLDPHS